MEYAALWMFLAAFGFLLLGYPVALTLGGTALLAAGIGVANGVFEPALLMATPNRLFGILTNQTLMAVPLRSPERARAARRRAAGAPARYPCDPVNARLSDRAAVRRPP